MSSRFVCLCDKNGPFVSSGHFGHDAVREVLAFWNVDLTEPEH